MNARVWVNATTADRAALEAAVLSGGGEPCASDEANAIVWAATTAQDQATPQTREPGG